ncbi:hypothetical protein L195_g061546, partial [Trifolium pratense]
MMKGRDKLVKKRNLPLSSTNLSEFDPIKAPLAKTGRESISEEAEAINDGSL